MRRRKAAGVLATTTAAMMTALAGCTPTIDAPTAADLAVPTTDMPSTTAPDVVELPTPTAAEPEAAPAAGQDSTTTTTEAAPTAPATTRAPAGASVVAGRGLVNDETLACIRSYEQGAAGYATETGNGHHGAYQFTQGTWDTAVAAAGFPEWVGRRAGDAPPHVQDAAASWLLDNYGLGPWPTPARYCG